MCIDSFMYNGEENILEIRLETLNDFIDKFIILESPRSHSQIPRSLEFYKQKERFKKFIDKISYYAVDYCSNSNFTLNDFQGRMVIQNILINQFNIKNDDLVLHGDLDEIPNPYKLKEILENDKELSKPYTFMMDNRVLCFDLSCNSPIGLFPGTMLLKGKLLFNYQLYDLRANRQNVHQKDCFNLLDNSGWHLGYCAGIEKTMDKFRFYCHAKETNNWLKDKESLINCIKTKTGFTPDKPELKLVEWKKENFPLFIFNNPDKFKEQLSWNY